MGQYALRAPTGRPVSVAPFALSAACPRARVWPYIGVFGGKLMAMLAVGFSKILKGPVPDGVLCIFFTGAPPQVFRPVVCGVAVKVPSLGTVRPWPHESLADEVVYQPGAPVDRDVPVALFSHVSDEYATRFCVVATAVTHPLRERPYFTLIACLVARFAGDWEPYGCHVTNTIMGGKCA